jgi:hypothetical protein
MQIQNKNSLFFQFNRSIFPACNCIPTGVEGPGLTYYCYLYWSTASTIIKQMLALIPRLTNIYIYSESRYNEIYKLPNRFEVSIFNWTRSNCCETYNNHHILSGCRSVFEEYITQELMNIKQHCIDRKETNHNAPTPISSLELVNRAGWRWILLPFLKQINRKGLQYIRFAFDGLFTWKKSFNLPVTRHSKLQLEEILVEERKEFKQAFHLIITSFLILRGQVLIVSPHPTKR